jgi:hypothetical protein
MDLHLYSPVCLHGIILFMAILLYQFEGLNNKKMSFLFEITNDFVYFQCVQV